MLEPIQTTSQTVAGDHNIFSATGDVYVYQSPAPLSPDDAKRRRDLNILLNRVKEFWIEGVLENSLYNLPLFDLSKDIVEEAIDKAANPLEQILELPTQPYRNLSPDQKIVDIFDELQGGLLILGEPGSGKTVTLLQLTHDLINRVENDKTFSQPIPVVYNLSSWTEGQYLTDWMVQQLSVLYKIPKQIGRQWLKENRLLPMLDGLDEVSLERQVGCVEAINQAVDQFGLAGLVVCSRIKDYSRLPIRLKLNGAICLQPLSQEQVNDYLTTAEDRFAGLRATLEEDKTLQELAHFPLTFGVMSLAYENVSSQDLTTQALDTTEKRRKHLFDAYVERMFKRKGEKGKRYDQNHTKIRLSWLAQQLAKNNQSIFGSGIL